MGCSSLPYSPLFHLREQKNNRVFLSELEVLAYKEVLARGLKVMDLTAICMCQDNNLPIYVFNMDVVGNLMKVMEGQDIGTLVHP